MACAGVLLFSAPQLVLRLFTDEPEVIRIGVTLIYLAAVFQLFDGLQVVATGALRGAGDTKRPMLANLVAHWFLGLPIGWWLGLRLGWGAPGVWTGLCLGLIAVGGVLVAVWATRLERLRHASARV